MTAQSRITLAPLLVPPPRVRAAPARRPVRDIAIEVSAETGIPVADIYGRSRRAPIVRARRMVWQRARSQGLSLPQIGRTTGHDHTTVLHGLRRIEAEELA